MYLALEMSYSVHFKHCESRKDRRNRGYLGELRYLSTETRLGGGERGIRTLGTLLTHTRFPSEPIRPLWHLSILFHSIGLAPTADQLLSFPRIVGGISRCWKRCYLIITFDNLTCPFLIHFINTDNGMHRNIAAFN